MKKVSLMITALFVCLIIVSCDDDNLSISCEQEVIIDAGTYDTAPTDDLKINSLDIDGDCLRINYSSSGCGGDTWILQLIDSDVILESFPPQRNLIFSLKNEELCEAYITRELTFDIINLQVNGNQVLLNIKNTNDEILYEY